MFIIDSSIATFPTMIYRVVLIGLALAAPAPDAFRLTNGLIREAGDFPAGEKTSRRRRPRRPRSTR